MPYRWIPKGFYWQNYWQGIRGNDGSFIYLRNILNSLIVASAVTMTTVFLSALTGFGLAKYQFKGRPLVFMMIPIADVIIFPTLVGLALHFRRRSDIHKRLMLLGTLAILTPAIARIWFIRPYGIPAFLGLTALFIVGAIAYDRIRNGRFHPAFVWGGLFVGSGSVSRSA